MCYLNVLSIIMNIWRKDIDIILGLKKRKFYEDFLIHWSIRILRSKQIL
jgi:hypothetical protein